MSKPPLEFTHYPDRQNPPAEQADESTPIPPPTQAPISIQTSKPSTQDLTTRGEKPQYPLPENMKKISIAKGEYEALCYKAAEYDRLVDQTNGILRQMAELKVSRPESWKMIVTNVSFLDRVDLIFQRVLAMALMETANRQLLESELADIKLKGDI